MCCRLVVQNVLLDHLEVPVFAWNVSVLQGDENGISVLPFKPLLCFQSSFRPSCIRIKVVLEKVRLQGVGKDGREREREIFKPRRVPLQEMSGRDFQQKWTPLPTKLPFPDSPLEFEPQYCRKESAFTPETILRTLYMSRFQIASRALRAKCSRPPKPDTLQSLTKWQEGKNEGIVLVQQCVCV